MPNYKLYYFNGRGRAECCRLMFAAAGVKYEDIRLQGEEWTKQKADFKFSQLPEIDIDGKRFSQSRAIMFYLAREFGFYPKTSLEMFAADEIIFLLEDMISALVKAMFAKEDKEQLLKDFKEGQLEKSLANFEKLYNLNGDKGVLVGSTVSVADIAIFDTMSGMAIRFEGCLDKYPGVKKVVDKVGAIAGIKKWVAERPDTQF